MESDFRPNRTVEFHWYSAEVRLIRHPCYRGWSSRKCLGGRPFGFPSCRQGLQGPWDQGRRYEPVRHDRLGQEGKSGGSWRYHRLYRQQVDPVQQGVGRRVPLHTLRRDQVWLRLQRSCFLGEGRIPRYLHHRERIRQLEPPYPQRQRVRYFFPLAVFSSLLMISRSRIDISDEFSFSHLLEFSKLAVAFAIELGGW